MKSILSISNISQLTFHSILLYFPIYFFSSLNFYTSNEAFIEKYLIIFAINLLCFYLLNKFSKDNYFFTNLKFSTLIISNIVYSKLLFFDYNLFFPNEMQTYITVNIFFIIFSIVLINNLFYTNKMILIQFIIFLAIFHVELFGIYTIYMFYKFKFKFEFSTFEGKVFTFAPIISISLKGISLLSSQLDFIWRSLIRKPYSGEARFYDLQWNLLYMKCNDGLIEGENLLFGSFMECPPIYSPFFNFFTLTSDLKTNTYITFVIFYIFSVFGYMKLLKKYNDKSILITLLFLSPPVNFLFYQGNFDIVPLFVVMIIYTIVRSTYLKLILIFLISIIEIHPITILVGFLVVLIKKKNVGEFIFGLLLLTVFILYLFFDFENNKFSNNFLDAQLGQSTYVNDIYASFGLKLDLYPISELLDINIYLLVMLFTILLILLFPHINYEHKVNVFEFTPLALWFVSIVVLENPIYRLSMSLILFIILFELFEVKVKYFLLFSFFLNPSPFFSIKESIEFHIINSYSQFSQLSINLLDAINVIELIIVFLNRTGIYILTIFLIREIVKKIFNIEKVFN